MLVNLRILRKFCCIGVLFCLAQAAWALEAFTVADIQVEGLQRVESGTVFASIPVKVGDTFTDEMYAASIRSLFTLGLFKDVRIQTKDRTVVIVVEELPLIAAVDFSGTKEFEKEVLTKALRDIGLAEGRPLDKALVDRAEQELKRLYINRSMYATQIVTTVTPIERNRANLSFAVVEGDRAKISAIRIIGNKAFSDSTLRGVMDSDTGTWLSWYTKSNQYARTKLSADLETLRSYYLARGYLEFRIDSHQIAMTPDKQGIIITINVTEGERFVVSKIALEGNYLDKADEFRALVAIQAGKPYNADQVAQTTKAFTDYFGNFGFAFARVEAVPKIDRATNRVEISLVADPSRRVYVRRINVAGNDRTRDEVIRREFRQLEASWFDGEKIRQSRNRVDRLGYFKEVNLDWQEVPGSFDQADITVTVVEKPTGSVSLGAGLSSGEGLGLTFGFKQENVFGSGSSLGMEVNTSKFNRTLVFSTTNPYITEDGVSRTLDLYQRKSKPYIDLDSYEIETTGAGVRFGIPITESDTIFTGIGVDRTTIVPGSFLPPVYQEFANEFGYTSNAVPLTLGWARDTRDSSLVPSTGRVLRATGEWSVGGELRYARGTAQFQQYYPFTKKITGAFNSELSMGAGLGGKSYPIFKNYASGGLGSVRGFEQASLTTGAQRERGLVATGGAKKVTFNAEVLSPLPGGGNDRTLRMYAFVDAGGIYGSDENIVWGDMRSSWGVGISWVSPVGPLRLAYARPLKKFEDDRLQHLQFQIGTSF